MQSWQEQQIQTLLTCRSETELFQQILKLAGTIGIDYCAYGMRMPLPISAPKTAMFNNYPKDWQARYKRENYLGVDPTVKRACSSTLPFLWSEDMFELAPEFWEDARSYGLDFGWVHSCRDAQGNIGVLTLARAKEDWSKNELHANSAEVNWLLQIAHQGMSRFLVPKLLPEAEAALSKREIEVLRWTAEGKTSGEVADILRIAERTVNFHINNAVVKLGANNKTAAAIRASVLGLLY